MKRILITVLLIFSTLLFYASYASSYNFTVEPDEATVKPEDEVSISLKISDIDAGEEGINVVETTLSYDESIIENVSFVDKNNWKSTYNPNEGDLHGKLLYTKMVSGVKNDEEIGVLKVKIKSDLTNSFTTEVKLAQVTSNDGYTLMNVGDKKVILNYVAPTPTPEPEPTPNPTPTEEPKNEPETSTETKTSPVKKDDGTAPFSTQTGDAIVYVSLVLGVCVILLVLLIILGKKIREEDKKEDTSESKNEVRTEIKDENNK